MHLVALNNYKDVNLKHVKMVQQYRFRLSCLVVNRRHLVVKHSNVHSNDDAVNHCDVDLQCDVDLD